MKTITLSEFNKNFVLRQQWKPLRDLAAKEAYKVIFDFTWVRMMTSSVADEIFGKWFNEFWNVFKIKWLEENDQIRHIISWVILNRQRVPY